MVSISNVNRQDLDDLLESKKKSDIRKAIKVISKSELSGYEDSLFAILSKSIYDEKFWESNVQIITYLGLKKYRNAIPLLNDVCIKNEEHDMVTSSSSLALCRIERRNIKDTSTVKKQLSYGKFSVFNGALLSLGLDKIVPVLLDMDIILKKTNDFSPYYEKGYSDVRVGLALACAGWLENQNSIFFLNECLTSEYSPLVSIAKTSLKGKYKKIN